MNHPRQPTRPHHSAPTSVQISCSDQLFRSVVQNSCSEQLFRTVVQISSSEQQFRTTVQNSRSEQQFGTAVRNSSSEQQFGTAVRNSSSEQRFGTVMEPVGPGHAARSPHDRGRFSALRERALRAGTRDGPRLRCRAPSELPCRAWQAPRQCRRRRQSPRP
jgi:hypothetical protein